jgi:amino acid transporter
MTIVAVVSLRWIPRSARIGPPALLLWVLAALAFFLPLALALTELSRRHPEQGGLYAWVRRAFGPVHGFVCGWCLWVNNLFYFPSLLLFGAANVLLVGGSEAAALAENRAWSVGFVLVVLWALVGLNIVGLTQGKRLQNVGSVATWIPAALLVVFGAVAFARHGSATPFTADALAPRGDLLATLSLWTAMCFGFSGLEITALVGREVKDAERTIPRGILIAGGAILVIYVAGAASVLVALPPDALAERSGISDAVDMAAGRLGLAGLGGLTGLLLAIAAVAGTSSWIAGAARVPFAAGVDHVLPRAFARLHARYRTPHVSLLVQGAAASAIFLASVFLTVTGTDTTIQEAYDILVSLTILIYFVPYLYLFPAFLRIVRPGPALTAAACAGFLATGVSLALVFVPPPGTENVLNYLVNLAGQALVIMAVGAALFWRASLGTWRRST